jgi:hypothetical protein
VRKKGKHFLELNLSQKQSVIASATKQSAKLLRKTSAQFFIPSLKLRKTSLETWQIASLHSQ